MSDEKQPVRVGFYAYEQMPDYLRDAVDLKTTGERLARKTDAERYRGKQGVAYEEPACLGYTSIEVLPFLWGQPLNDLAMAYVHALRPSRVCVSQGVVTTDCCCWRVTVFVDEGDRISKITQEVQVGYDDGFTIRRLLHAQKTGTEPEPSGGCFGNISGLARVDFQ
jgi:hypothetical protein